MSDITIENDNIFEAEPEKTIDDLLQNLPPGLADYLIASKKILEEGFQKLPQPITNQPWTPPEFEFHVEQFIIGATELNTQMTTLLNHGWGVFGMTNYDKWLVVVFNRMKNPTLT
jgi:hypothetical protein